MSASTVVLLPVSALNGSHQHWQTVAGRRKRERQTAMLLCPKATLPAMVRLVRLSAGTLDDDNLLAALKSVRDGIADRLGVADNDPGVTWAYGQERCKRGTYGVRVELVAGFEKQSNEIKQCAVQSQHLRRTGGTGCGGRPELLESIKETAGWRCGLHKT